MSEYRFKRYPSRFSVEVDGEHYPFTRWELDGIIFYTDPFFPGGPETKKEEEIHQEMERTVNTFYNALRKGDVFVAYG